MRSRTLLFATCLLACGAVPGEGDGIDEYAASDEDGEACSCVPATTPGFREVENGFYAGPNGTLYLKTVWLGEDGRPTGPEFFRPTPVVDACAYRTLGDEGWYATDGFSVYADQETTLGRMLWLVEDADPASFEWTGYRAGRDARHVFYGGRIVPEMHGAPDEAENDER